MSSPLFDGDVEEEEEDEAALGRRREGGDRNGGGDSGEERIRTSTDELDDDERRRRRWAWLLLAGVRSDSAMVVARVERRSRVRFLSKEALRSAKRKLAAAVAERCESQRNQKKKEETFFCGEEEAVDDSSRRRKTSLRNQKLSFFGAISQNQ